MFWLLRGKWNWKRRSPQGSAVVSNENRPSDLPRVVTTSIAGHSHPAGGGVRLSRGARSRFGLDLTDMVLPVIVIGTALAFVNRGCSSKPPANAEIHSSGGPHLPVEVRPQVESTRSALHGHPKVATAVVVLDVEIQPDGTAGTITIVRGAGMLADQRAIQKVQEGSFEPLKRGGVAIASHRQISVEVPVR